MITIAEVIEQCAQTAEGFDACDPKYVAAAIHALAAQYEGCVVAEGEVEAYLEDHGTGANLTWIPRDDVPNAALYRARETQR